MNPFLTLIDLLLMLAAQASGRFTVDDLPDDEMGTRSFKLVDPFVKEGIPKDAEVTIIAWNGLLGVAYCTVMSDGRLIWINKHLLLPIFPITNGMRTYKIGLAKQRTSVERGMEKVEQQQKKLDEWTAVESSYNANHNFWVDEYNDRSIELDRRKVILENKEAQMSRLLVRETMYNRFDPLILKWVNYYNTDRNPGQALDLNVIKSIIFEESNMGTSGKREHLLPPPYNTQLQGIHSRFNIGQAIDSSGPILYLMMKEMGTAIYTQYGLDALEDQALWKGMTNDQYDAWNGGKYLVALDKFFKHRDASDNNLMGTHGKHLYEDYEFWIRSCVRWLFYKYESQNSPSWANAVRAYNGSPSASTNYMNRVMDRVGSTSDLYVENK